jgi:hypothetical protein
VDQPRAQEIAKAAAEKWGKTADEAGRQAGAEGQPTLDEGKELVQGLANQASFAPFPRSPMSFMSSLRNRRCRRSYRQSPNAGSRLPERVCS